MMGCRFTKLVRRDIILDPPFRLPAWSVEGDLAEERPPLGGQRLGGSRGWSSAELFLWIRLCALCHHVRLADDLAIVHLKCRFDPQPSVVRVLASLPKRHQILADDLPLDAVGRPLPVDRSQVLGDLGLPPKLEGGASSDLSVDDA